MNPSEHQRLSKERQEWASCDPVTLVSAAREGLYVAADGGKQREQFAPLEEVISRFEQQSRAALGTGVFAAGEPVTTR